MKRKDLPAPEFTQGLRDFLALLKDMEIKRETMRTISGELEGPLGSKAAYGCTIRLGIVRKETKVR